ncbi:ligand-binding sensor domain-containing protein [Marilutibacter alkalisoli]|nr:two-component regulator propeller domain-containing protein [Lysobacter alkalisoli]
MRLMALAFGLLVWCGPVLASTAVHPDYRVRPKVFTDDDGLPPSGVSALVQARDGYLWVGTFGGLARFDGRTFRTYRDRHVPGSLHVDGEPETGPSSDRIVALHEDDEGRLWIGTEDAGLSVLEHGEFRHLPFCDGLCQINDILQGPDRGIWVASSEGVFKLDPVSGQVVWSGRSSPAGYTRLASDGLGRIHVAGYESFHVVAGQQLRPIRLPGGNRGVRLLEGNGDGLLVGTERELYRYDPVRQQWQPLGVEEPALAARDAEGLWWVSQLSGKVVREDGMGGWAHVPELSGMGIISLAWDDEGDLWAGSGSKGLLRTRKPLFGLFSTSQLGTNMAGRAIIGDGNGGLWFGSACGGVHHWSHDGGVQALPLRKAQVGECVTSLLLDHEGVLWVGTGEGGWRG